MKISYCAPAKVILSGEHAVVYGKPALVCSIDKKLTVTFFSSKKVSNNNKFFLSIFNQIRTFLIKKKLNPPLKKFDFKIDSEIPIGQGLGSSASLSTALISAYLEFHFQKEFNKDFVNQLAYQLEKIFHKNPSGVDNTAVTFGGLIYYRKEFEFLKNISLLNFKIPQEIEEKLFLINSGKPKETTKEMVNLVTDLANKKPKFLEKVLSAIEKTTKEMVISLVKKDKNLFQKALINNQIYLEKLGVVSQKTKLLLKRLKKFGVGKITGAGGKKEGSGFIIFYTQNKEKLINFLKKEKINYFKFIPNYKGLTKL